MTRSGRIFWLTYLAWLALIAASVAGVLPVRWYLVAAAPFVVIAGGLLSWTAWMTALTWFYALRAFFAGRRRSSR